MITGGFDGFNSMAMGGVYVLDVPQLPFTRERMEAVLARHDFTEDVVHFLRIAADPERSAIVRSFAGYDALGCMVNDADLVGMFKASLSPDLPSNARVLAGKMLSLLETDELPGHDKHDTILKILREHRLEILRRGTGIVRRQDYPADFGGRLGSMQHRPVIRY